MEWCYPARRSDDARPDALSEMLRVASILSAPFDFIRVDLYTTGNEVRVGELTVCPGGASEVVTPIEMERALYHW